MESICIYQPVLQMARSGVGLAAYPQHEPILLILPPAC